MEFTILGIGILTWITFLPVIGMFIVLMLPKEGKDTIRWTSLAFTALQMVLAVVLYVKFDRTLAGINAEAGMQFVEKASWIDIQSVAWFGRVHIEYFLGIDGLSVAMVLLTALISFIATISSWSITKSLKGYFALLLLLDTGMMGVFVALDFFLFYVFWEVMLLPMYFLIGVWGGPRREYAAIKFFLYTLLGSVLMLLAMIALYFSTNVYIDPAGITYSITEAAKSGMQGLEKIHSFNIIAMMDPGNMVPGSLLFGWDTTWRYLAYGALFVGFAIKIPLFPFHTWLPDAHVEAPTPISVILAGVLLKMGDIRHAADQLPGVSRRHAAFLLGARASGGDQHGLRGTGGDGADRLQEAHRLFQCQPHGDRGARYGIDEHAGDDRARSSRCSTTAPSPRCSSLSWASSTTAPTREGSTNSAV